MLHRTALRSLVQAALREAAEPAAVPATPFGCSEDPVEVEADVLVIDAALEAELDALEAMEYQDPGEDPADFEDDDWDRSTTDAELDEADKARLAAMDEPVPCSVCCGRPGNPFYLSEEEYALLGRDERYEDADESLEWCPACDGLGLEDAAEVRRAEARSAEELLRYRAELEAFDGF